MGITIKDIARLAGVSIATVSKIRNNKDDSISQGTRERVLKIMEENNYVPNVMARSLVTKKTQTIGLVIPDIRNPFFPELARGAEDKANEEGYNIIFCNTDDDLNKEEKYINMLMEKMVDGIIFTAASRRNGCFESLKKITIPIILVDRDIDFDGVKGKITVDNLSGAYEGMKHLLNCGYRKIPFLSGPLSNRSSLDRLEGYKRALGEFGVDFKEEYILEGEYDSDWGYDGVKQILKDITAFDAIFCGSDVIAIGAIKSLKEQGIKVPMDVGILGFDDIYMAKLVNPELTTIKQPNYEMGYKAVEMLIDVLEKKTQHNEHLILDTKLIIRNSTNTREN